MPAKFETFPCTCSRGHQVVLRHPRVPVTSSTASAGAGGGRLVPIPLSAVVPYYADSQREPEFQAATVQSYQAPQLQPPSVVLPTLRAMGRARSATADVLTSAGDPGLGRRSGELRAHTGASQSPLTLPTGEPFNGGGGGGSGNLVLNALAAGGAVTQGNRTSAGPSPSNSTPITPVAHANPPASAVPSSAPAVPMYLGFPVSFLGNMLSPKSANFEKMFQLAVDGLTFVGHPLPLLLSHPTSDSERQGDLDGSGVLTSQPIGMSMFHIVLACCVDESTATTATIEEDQQEWLCRVHDRLLVRLATSLQAEEQQSRFLRNQVELILARKDELLRVDEDKYWQVVLQESLLARGLVSVWEQLVQQAPSVHVHWKDSLNLSIRMTPSSPNLLIAPFHALLPIGANNVETEQLFSDISPSLLLFMQAIAPHRRLEEVQRKLDWSWKQTLQHAKHLVEWGKANVILPLVPDSLLTVHAKADLSRAEAGFVARFPMVDLASLIARLPGNFRFSQVMPNKAESARALYTDVVAYLIQEGVLAQMTAVLYLKMTPIAGTEWGKDVASASTTILLPDTATYQDRMAVEQRAQEYGEEMGSFLLRLFPYLDGHCCLEEISWREQVSRKDLLAVLRHLHRDVLLLPIVYDEHRL